MNLVFTATELVKKYEKLQMRSVKVKKQDEKLSFFHLKKLSNIF